MKFKVFISGIVLIFAASCAVHNGTMINSASLSHNNFKIIGNVTGSSTSKIILGFGGMKKDALTLEAKQNMQSMYPLHAGQAYANITVDYKRSYWVFGITTKCTINADVVQFMETNYFPADTTEIQSVNGPTSFICKYSEKNGFALNRVVFFYDEKGNTVEGKILGLSDNDALVKYKDDTGKEQKIVLSQSRIRRNK